MQCNKYKHQRGDSCILYHEKRKFIFINFAGADWYCCFTRSFVIIVSFGCIQLSCREDRSASPPPPTGNIKHKHNSGSDVFFSGPENMKSACCLNALHADSKYAAFQSMHGTALHLQNGLRVVVLFWHHVFYLYWLQILYSNRDINTCYI
jgi:hypothetical protein